MKALNIIESGYRATLEEQDDTIVWITHAMKGAGADLDVLLRGNAVNYLVQGQDASGLSFGNENQTQPPQLAQDIAKLVEKGVTVYATEEDLQEMDSLLDATLDEKYAEMSPFFLSRFNPILARAWYRSTLGN